MNGFSTQQLAQIEQVVMKCIRCQRAQDKKPVDYRLENNLSREELAELACVSVKIIRDLERGNYRNLDHKNVQSNIVSVSRALNVMPTIYRSAVERQIKG